MKITIKTIPHSEQRYDTIGDWWFDKEDNLEIRVSSTISYYADALVAIHELCEALLCKARFISEDSVTRHDLNFTGEGQPGDSPDAPYCNEHCIAEGIERIMCSALGLKWEHYERVLDTAAHWPHKKP